MYITIHLLFQCYFSALQGYVLYSNMAMLTLSYIYYKACSHQRNKNKHMTHQHFPT